MTGSAEFKRDVGQVVMGDLNEAPRLNNVVHVNVGSKEIEPNPKPITNLQRKSIAAKVKELVAISELEQLDVYRVILTDFSVNNIAELPADQYKPVMALLDDWIAETKGDSDPPPQRRVTDQIPQTISVPLSCASCEQSIKAITAARRMTLLQTIVIIGAAAFVGWKTMTIQARAATEVETNCRFDGKTYSVGSTARMNSGALRECLNGPKGGAPYWGVPQKAGR